MIHRSSLLFSIMFTQVHRNVYVLFTLLKKVITESTSARLVCVRNINLYILTLDVSSYVGQFLYDSDTTKFIQKLESILFSYGF